MSDGYADMDAVLRRGRGAWKPPPKLSLSEWADEHFVLSAESAAEPGRWRTLPYQRGIMDAITDPSVSQVTWMKSARVGYTLCVSAAIGYHIHQDPASILVVQPTVEDAKEYSKETIAPMLRDVPVLAAIRYREVEDKGPKGSSNTLTHKAFPGGILSLIGANSGSGFRRKSRRIVIFDEVDAYPPSAGSEGDPISLGIKRSQAFWNRKIVAGSTPLVSGASRIEALFQAGDQRRFYVPCPSCGRMDFLTFSEQTGDGARGHWMHWDAPDGSDAHFVCRGCDCEIEHKHKREIIERGEWRADRPFKGHASFHIWAAYSYSPNDTWAQLAAEFLAAKSGGPEKLKTFINTVLGETWRERGEAPDWQRLYERREHYGIGTVPAGAALLTCGVDVQKDRLVWEVVGWGDNRESWSVDAGVFMGDTSAPGVWAELDGLLAQTWPTEAGGEMGLSMTAVDSGYNTQTVYNWARRHGMARVIACKGASTAKTILGAPSSVDLTWGGKRISRGYKVWTVGVDVSKSELYGWLRLPVPNKEKGEPYAPGYCHFPEHGEEYFKQITAEHLVSRVTQRGFTVYEWQVQPGRENHWLDCRVYARAAAVRAGLERLVTQAAHRPREAAPAPVPAPRSPTTPTVLPALPPPRREPRTGGGWLHGGRRPGGWLGGRR